MGRRAGLDDMEKRKFLPYPDSNSDPSVVQPVASPYTDYTIPASDNLNNMKKNIAILIDAGKEVGLGVNNRTCVDICLAEGRKCHRM
jgi:hypothetical protein